MFIQKNLDNTNIMDFINRENLFWQEPMIKPILRAGLMNQTPLCIWFTGLSGSGKSTLANLLEQKLYGRNFHTIVLDGDNLRQGLCADLNFSDHDRSENVRRVAEVAHLMINAGLIVIVALISPKENHREYAKKLFRKDEFIEVFVDVPINICEERDTKGLYAKARSGEIKLFTGVNDIYEFPNNPDVRVYSHLDDPEKCVQQIIEIFDLRQKGKN